MTFFSSKSVCLCVLLFVCLFVRYHSNSETTEYLSMSFFNIYLLVLDFKLIQLWGKLDQIWLVEGIVNAGNMFVLDFAVTDGCVV